VQLYEGDNMSNIVLGVAASHSTLMNTHWDDTEDMEGASRFRDALAQCRQAVEASKPDVAIVIGSNHFRGLWLDLMPSFTLGVGDVTAAGESGTPEGPLPTDIEFAQSLCDRVVADGFDLAFSGKLQVDHGISHAVQYVLAGLDVAVVPLVVNMFAPPLPALSRCVALGRALARGVSGDGLDRRVAVIASGGLSHDLPWPDWRTPDGDDDEFMVKAWLNGRTDWASYDARRREIILKSKALLNSEFDEDVLARLENGTLEDLTELEDTLTEVAGNGGNELRSWLMMAAACGFKPGQALAYAPMHEWYTGMAAGLIDLV
jgi:2,3-dihydroxyphenylpropionate 1,2-dioxygenase